MQTHTPLTLDAVPVLSWDGLARPTVIRTRRWYVLAGIVALATAIYGIVSGSWALAIVSILVGGMYGLIHDHPSPMAHIDLYDNGLQLDGHFVRWDQLAGFWILTTPDYTELRFVRRHVGKRLAIQLGTQDPEQLRMILTQRLPELTQMHESVLDVCIRLCKL